MRQRSKAKLTAAVVVAAGLLATSLAGGALATGTNQLPEGFEPMSSSWTSAEEGYVLGWSSSCDVQASCATIAVTDDGGATWTERPAPEVDASKGPRLFVTEQGDKSTWLVLYDSYVRSGFASYDAGETWQEENFDGLLYSQWDIASMTATSDYVYVVTDGFDGGSAQWADFIRSPIGEDAWEAVPGVDSGMGTNGGDAAMRGNSGIAAIQKKVHTTTDGSAWVGRDQMCDRATNVELLAAGGKGQLYKACDDPTLQHFDFFASQDDGASFAHSGTLDQAYLTDLAAADQTLVAGGDSCVLESSFDAGATWEQTLPGAGGEDMEIRDLQLSDAGTGTALCGLPGNTNGAQLYRTTDGGKTWEPIDFTNVAD